MSLTSGERSERSDWRISQFKIHGQPIYEGNHSKVFIATDLQGNNRKVAIKAYKSRKLGTLERMQITREVTIHRDLAHVNIIRLYGDFQDEAYHYVVTELAAGTLFDKLKEKNRLHGSESCLRFEEGDVALDVIKPLLEALGYLHAQGFIHRDIKPENILVSSDGVLKLADFGLVINSNVERPVSRIGTLDYMAPEVLQCPMKNHPTENKDRSDLAYSSQIDTWAVGVLAYEMLVGKPPFERGSRLETEHNIMFEEPDMNVPWLSGQAKDFIKSALNKFPRSRSTVEKLKKHSWLKYAKKTVHSLGGGLDPLLLLSSDEEGDLPQDLDLERTDSSHSITAQVSASSFSAQRATKNSLLEVAKSSKSLSSLHSLGSRPPSIVTVTRQEVLDASSSTSPNFQVARQGSGGLASPISMGRRSASPTKLAPIASLSTHLGALDSSPDVHLPEHGPELRRGKSVARFSEGPPSTAPEKNAPTSNHHEGSPHSGALQDLSLAMSKSSSSRDIRAMAASRFPRTSLTETDDEHERTSASPRASPYSRRQHSSVLDSSSSKDGPPLIPSPHRDASPMLGRRHRGSTSNDGGSKAPMSHLGPNPSHLGPNPSHLGPNPSPSQGHRPLTSQDGNKRTSATNLPSLPLLPQPPTNPRLTSARQGSKGICPSKSGGGGSPDYAAQHGTAQHGTPSPVQRDLKTTGGYGSPMGAKSSPTHVPHSLPKVPTLSLDSNSSGRRGSLSQVNVSRCLGESSVASSPSGSQTSRFSSVAAGPSKPPLRSEASSGGGGVHSLNSTQLREARLKVLQTLKK